jgi:hypothetical protein
MLETLIKEIEEAGTSELLFGGTWVGGYHIQQDPSELAKLVECLRTNISRAGSAGSYLGVGVAAGGTERFIAEKVGLDSLTIIDNGEHKQFDVWQKVNKPAIESRDIKVWEHIGDSHDEQADEFLRLWGGHYDIVGIDGDHSACGVRLDWRLVEPYIHKGTLVWLHDINVKRVHDQGPLELWEKLKNKYTVRLETYEAYGIGVVQI